MKTKEIERFLKSVDYVFENNSNVDYSTIYAMLARGTGDHAEINDLFPEWISYYKDRDNIKVFNKEDWSYFCQFVNGDIRTNRIKLYIPLPRDKIDKGAKKIFDFLAEKNVAHSSKIGSHVRTDDIVIRVDSLRNALGIINFIRNDNFLSESIMPTNPFVYNFNGVGLALDGNLSYNSTLSKAIYQYFSLRKKQKITTKPNAQEFCRFIKALEINAPGKDLRMIYKLIRQNADGTIDMSRFIDDVNEYQENELLLDKVIEATRSKYGDEHAINSLMKASNDNFGSITNDSDSRRQAIRYLSGVQIKRIINNRCGYNNEEVAKDVAVDYMSKIDWKKNAIADKINALSYGLIETARKKGFEYDAAELTLRLKTFIVNREYSVFTRDHGARQRVFDNIKENDSIIALIIKHLGLEEPVINTDIPKLFVEREILNIDAKKK